jgi:diguanylate cyclase (GGDEF)-like protein
VAKNSFLLAFFLAMQSIGIATAFLGYHYLQIVNDYRDRNFLHLTKLQDSLDIISENYFPNVAQLRSIRANVSSAQRQALWCTQNLNKTEMAVFDWMGMGPAMDLCVSNVLAADAVGSVVTEMEGIAQTATRFGSDYLALKADLETRLKDMREESKRIQPYVDRIEHTVIGVVEIGTMGAGVVLALLIIWASRMVSRLMRRLKSQNKDLENANLRFDLAMNSIADGFALYDRNLRLVACNGHYRQLSTLAPDSILTGMHVSEVLRNGAESGIYPEIAGDGTEEFVRQKTELMRVAEMEEVHFVLTGDRHVRAKITNSGLGDKVVIRTDITDFVRAHRAQMEHAESLTRANQEIRHKSLHDPLTDLPNRRLLDAELARRLQRGPVTVIRVDLDRFKQVNDVLGHKAGDFVLCCVADILRDEKREGDLASRFGGDEFVVLCREGTSEDEARTLAEKMLARIVEPLQFEGKPCRFGASFGIASSRMRKCDGGELLSFADAALYAAKNAGRRTVETFSPALHKQFIEERLLGDEFSNALERGEIVPFFQTQHDAVTQEIVGAEVLARWQNPRRGLLSPPAFLDVVRKLGMESQLDAAIFDASVTILKEFGARGISLPKTSFNVSAGRLLDPDFLDTARRSLSGINTRFAFEILESISLEDMDDVFFFTIESLKELGFAIEIDDFGSGHASIASVMDIAPHALKIDRRLVAPLMHSDRNTQMIASIIQLAQALDIGVTAEGVETEDLARTLARLGCNTLQGYWFSRPEPADVLLRRLEKATRVARPRSA